MANATAAAADVLPQEQEDAQFDMWQRRRRSMAGYSDSPTRCAGMIQHCCLACHLLRSQSTGLLMEACVHFLFAILPLDVTISLHLLQASCHRKDPARWR